MLKRHIIHLDNSKTTIEISAFQTAGGVRECHVMIHVSPCSEMFGKQMERLSLAWQEIMTLPEMQGAKVVFKRYFLSDATNQTPLIDDRDECTKSFIQQPPLDGSKVAMWAYLVEGAEVIYSADETNSTIVRHNGYEHIWTMGMTNSNADSFVQTQLLLEKYERLLSERYDSTIAENCIRTWFFVRDVDTNYEGLVHARRENFLKNGLTPQTHYIASTGIGGSPAESSALVQLGTYAMTGLKKDQQQYLYALDHLNRTIEYNVTFERGTMVKYGDRTHALISGTASIDNKGQVMHVGEIEKQTYRMWENVEALLKEAEMTFDNVMQVIVYLRDIADYSVTERLFRNKFHDMPLVITLAPVCRPQWLIEMECMAVSDKGHKEYKDF